MVPGSLRRTLVIALLLAGAAVTASSAEHWVPFGPDGASVLALAVDPQAPRTVWAGTRFLGVFKSTDGGGTWRAASAGLPDREVHALAVSPGRPATLYAATSSHGLYESADGGESWTPVGGPVSGEGVRVVDVVAARPATLHVLIVEEGGHPFLWKSTDGGRHWAREGQGLVDNVYVDLAIDPRAPRFLYAAVSTNGLSRSMDGGATWAPSIGATEEVLSVTVDPVTGAVYAGTLASGVLRSRDHGGTWQRPARRWTRGPVAALAARGSVVWAGTHADVYLQMGPGGILRSADGGVTWRDASRGLRQIPDVRALALDPRAPSTLYAGDGSWGVYKSADSGTRWALASRGLRGVIVDEVAVDPRRSRTVYAGTLGAGLWKTIDGGRRWSSLSLSEVSVFSLAVDPVHPDTVYASVYASGQTLWKSVDGGGFWSPVGRGLREARLTGPLLVDPRRPATVYAGVFSGVARSRNGGLDFPYVARLEQCALITALRAAPGGALWAGASDFGDQCSDEPVGGVFLSTDGGTTWSHADAGLLRLVDDLVVDPAVPTTLYAAVPGGSGGVWRTADRGASWQRTAFEVPEDNRPTALAIASGSPSTVYAGVSGPEGGVWASRDAGATWTRLGGDDLNGLNSLEGLQVRDLTFDPRAHTLYAATTAGVFRLVAN